MSDSRNELIERIFLEAIELDAGAARSMVAMRCGDDVALRQEVESLLEFSSRAERFLDHKELLDVNPELVRPTEDVLEPGTTVGDYRVVRMLGSGGMGVVYVATQDRPRRTVAMKLVNASIASPSMRRRFELEAEVLGRLQHPGIAQVFEAGAALIGGGEIRRPFIAMELVDGPAITEYCQSRGLDHRQRIALFISVCDAVQHAHQRGVIHRDLKPANVLVTSEGQPKVLDFGVARATDAGKHVTTIVTGIGQMIGTLPYMSPEQVLGDPREVDTRADVYSLGVMLYELLTGGLPLDVSGRSLPEAVRSIRQDDPQRLSAHNRSFRGELDTILAMALEKDKTRRYQSAAELGDDLRRFLEGRPVIAKDASAFYVLRKQMKRYRGVVALAALTVVFLIAFAVHAAYRARVERGLASAERAARVDAVEARDHANEQAEALRRNLYVSAIGFAQAAFTSNDASRVVRVLESCPEDLRGWEWRYLRGVADASFSVVRLSGPHQSTTLSHDGRMYVGMVPGEWTRVYDSQSGRTIAEFPPVDSVLFPAILSADGRTVLTADLSGRQYFHEVATCHTSVLQPADQRFAAPLLALDGLRSLLVYKDKGPRHDEISHVRAEDGAVLTTFFTDMLVECAVSADESTFAFGEPDGSVWIAPVGATKTLVFKHELQVRDIAFSHAGDMLATASSDGSVAIIPVHGGPPAQHRVFSNKATAIAWRPDGRYLAVGGTEGVIHVIDPRTGEILTTLLGHGATVAQLAWDGPSNTIASHSGDHTVRTWANPEFPRQPRIASDSSFTAGAWSLDGERVLLGNLKGEVVSYRAEDLGDAHTLLELGDYVTEIELSHDGSLLVAASENGAVAVYSLRDNAVVSRWTSPNSRAIDADFDNVGERVVLGSDTPGMTIWDARTGRLLVHDQQRPTAVIRADWSPDGRWIAAAYYDQIVRIHDTRDWRIVREFNGPTLWVSEIRFSHDSKQVIAASDDGEIYVWDLDGPPSPRLISVHVRGAYGMSISPDATRIATGGYDNTFRVSDFATGEELLMFRRHNGAVWVSDFSPDGSRILSAATDGSALIWDARPSDPDQRLAQLHPSITKAKR